MEKLSISLLENPTSLRRKSAQFVVIIDSNDVALCYNFVGFEGIGKYGIKKGNMQKFRQAPSLDILIDWEERISPKVSCLIFPSNCILLISSFLLKPSISYSLFTATTKPDSSIVLYILSNLRIALNMSSKLKISLALSKNCNSMVHL